MTNPAFPFVITVVHMGDSITYGQYVDPAQRWTSLVGDRLTRQYLDSPVQLLLLNRGVSGETTRMGLERFPADVQTHSPDIMTLQFGLNDCNCWPTDRGLPRVSEVAFRANLIEMAERAKRFGVKYIVLANNHRTLRHKVMLSGKTYEEANARYSQITQQVAEETKMVFCDIRQAFASYTTEELDELLLPYPDHLHLSPKGNQVYAEAIWPLFQRCVDDVVQIKSSEKELT